MPTHGWHTVEVLEQALLAARQLGYTLRQEWLGGSGGGPCEIKGTKWLFLDLALSPADQLQQVLDAIQSEPAAQQMELAPPLRNMVQWRRSA